MDVLKVVLICTYMAVFFNESYGENNDLASKSTAVKLSNELFYSYNKNIRPVMKQSTQTTINTTFYIFNVHMDEKWEVLKMSVQLVMSWKDEYLVWDPTKYDNIEVLFEDSTIVWLPDIMSYDMGFNGADSKDYSYSLPPSVVKITNTGVVKYNHRITLTTQCSTNIAKWPFDSHNCTFSLGSPLYTNTYVNYSFPHGPYSLNYYNPDREWEVDNIDFQCRNIFEIKPSYCVIEYYINVVRFSSMYYSSVIIPGIVISLMRTLTFLMGREISFRIILLCLFFISEVLFIQFLDTKIPNNGEYQVYIVLLYRNSLVLTATALIISVISNVLYKHSTEDFPRAGPEWLKSTLKFLLNKKPIAMLTNFNNQGAELLIESNTEEDTAINGQRDENALLWKTLSVLLDRSSFVIILVISLINFCSFIP